MKINLPVIPLYDYGTGPAIILLPYSISDFNNWETLLKSLSPSYRILIPRLPLLTSPLSQDRLNDVKNYLLHFIESHNLNKIILIGNSINNELAVQFATDNTNECRALILNLSNSELITRPVLHPLHPKQKSFIKTNQHRLHTELGNQRESATFLDLIDHHRTEPRSTNIPLLIISHNSSEMDLNYWTGRTRCFSNVKRLLTLHDCVSDVNRKIEYPRNHIADFIFGKHSK